MNNGIGVVLENLDLFSVGLTAAGSAVLGFVVFLSNRRSITNKTFLLFATISVFWGIANYINYKVTSPILVLWSLRIVIFLAVWHAFSFFQLFYVFPKEEVSFPRWYKFFFFPAVILSSIINLSPLAFSNIHTLADNGGVSTVDKGPGMLLFIILVVFSIIGGLYLLIRKNIRAQDEEKAQFRLLLIGATITFICLFLFNFFLPAVFDWVVLMPLGAVFIFPFIAFTTYSIFKHHLMGMKVLATEFLTFILAIASFIEIIISGDIGTIIFRSGVFVLILGIGIMLITSVRREVEQREKLEILTKELSAANEKLKELDKLKSEFLSFASHQIKSPISVIKGFATLIMDGTYGEVNEKVKETSGRIKESSDRLINMVNDFLNLRKIEEGKMEYVLEPMDIVKFVSEIVDEYKTLADDKNLKLVLEVTWKGEINVKADASRLHHVIQNLIDNAIKYTDQGEIKVKIERHENSVLISVKDTGRGISVKIINKLFEQYQRDPATKNEIQGTGLGLFIAKKIVDAHGGRIWAESPGEGQGSIFFLELPLLT